MVVIAPLLLYVRLVQNWLLGEFGCYFLSICQVNYFQAPSIFNPIFQDLPAHIYMLSMFVANLVRYSNLLFPANSRPTMSLLLPLCWLVSLLLVLPYLPNIQHYELQNVSKCNGGQLCALEEDEARGKLVRGTFLLL